MIDSAGLMFLTSSRKKKEKKPSYNKLKLTFAAP